MDRMATSDSPHSQSGIRVFLSQSSHVCESPAIAIDILLLNQRTEVFVTKKARNTTKNCPYVYARHQNARYFKSLQLESDSMSMLNANNGKRHENAGIALDSSLRCRLAVFVRMQAQRMALILEITREKSELWC
jgi:hypothetical protein